MILIDRLSAGRGDAVEAARELRGRYDLESVIVTRGERGAFLCGRDGACLEAQPAAVGVLRSSVGAGDAFSAVMILGIIHDWPTETALRRANDFAASICGIEGAVPDSKEFYDGVLNDWK
jgi:fructokinase